MIPCPAHGLPLTDRMQAQSSDTPVLILEDAKPGEVQRFLTRLGLELVVQSDQATIEGSYWGDEEAGLKGNRLFARPDTPLHSILHEACHYVCMDPDRRSGLDTNAGGDYEEENGVCFLQIILADQLSGFGRERMMADMDAWGYTFRLGSARRWFEGDADDARQFLVRHGLIDREERPTWTLRMSSTGV